jgi:aspartate/methionine/tyrosine aminotransferase
MSQQRAFCYEPAPFGLMAARQAVSDEFARRGAAVPPNHILLTASTSEAYALLFKLLCDPGDVVLAPRPSYPLVEHLADLECVSLDHYTLVFHGRWSVDEHELREKLSAPAGRRIRAIVIISPNNPTGSVLTDAELEVMASLARAHQAALIADEVFADYSMRSVPAPCVLRQSGALAFALGGLSKSAGLPQVKMGWIGVGGPSSLVDEALDRLETISDAYLSVSTPVQVAAPDLLRGGAGVRVQIQERVRQNISLLTAAAAACPACSVLPVEAGWYGVVQVPAMKSEEMIVLDLLDRTGILVHPGYFYDFEREAFLVLSLLPEPDVFRPAVEAIFSEMGRVR